MAFENTAAVASGVEAGHKVLIRKGPWADDGAKVSGSLPFAGDGATAGIGMQALSGALERGHDFTCIHLLGQRSLHEYGRPALQLHVLGRRHHHQPGGQEVQGPDDLEKNMATIAAAHNIPYVVTASPVFHLDLMNADSGEVSHAFHLKRAS
ncbi:hypothetical protein DFAR_3590007 [Desulfarculales bacterium]